jgi:hypothetical protein
MLLAVNSVFGTVRVSLFSVRTRVVQEADGLDDALALAPRDPVADVEVGVGDQKEAADERADDFLARHADRERRRGDDERRPGQHLPEPCGRDAERQRHEEDDQLEASPDRVLDLPVVRVALADDPDHRAPDKYLSDGVDEEEGHRELAERKQDFAVGLRGRVHDLLKWIEHLKRMQFHRFACIDTVVRVLTAGGSRSRLLRKRRIATPETTDHYSGSRQSPTPGADRPLGRRP